MRPALLKSTAELLRRSRGYASSANPERKVAILGAAGGIGQPLSLLMKLNEFEKKGLENLKGELKSSIDKGIKFAHGN
uniref:malate dehydrogenase n=1 Tax=Zea mays TaxID=4577 RepID=B6U5H4_MAIZE|nr:hypothetical protein [Zea mays]